MSNHLLPLLEKGAAISIRTVHYKLRLSGVRRDNRMALRHATSSTLEWAANSWFGVIIL